MRPEVRTVNVRGEEEIMFRVGTIPHNQNLKSLATNYFNLTDLNGPENFFIQVSRKLLDICTANIKLKT